MCGVEALPLVHAFSLSEKADERALFVRVYLDLLAERSRRGEAPPPDWRESLQACLRRSEPAERERYLAEIGRAGAERRAKLSPSPPTEGFAYAGRDEIEAVLRDGPLGRWIALAAEPKARLRPEQFDALALRARALAEEGDRRLADALLSREPIRIEAAPLFLEASPAQRRAILLAAQRNALGRLGVSPPRLDEAEVGRLEFAALAGDPRDFSSALAAALGVGPDLAARIAADPHGEPLAVALVALGAPRDVVVRVLTARDIEESEGFPRVHALARLSESLSSGAARRIVAALIGAATHSAASALGPSSGRAPPPLRRTVSPAAPRAQPRNESTFGAR